MTPLLIASIRANPEGNWILVHLDGDRASVEERIKAVEHWPPNLQLVHTTEAEVQALAERKLGVSFKQPLKTMQGPKSTKKQ